MPCLGQAYESLMYAMSVHKETFVDDLQERLPRHKEEDSECLELLCMFR